MRHEALHPHLNPEAFSPPMPMGPARPSESSVGTGETKVEALKKLNKDEMNLGDLNPLIHRVDLTRKDSVEAVSLTIMDEIEKFGGLAPTLLESTFVIEPNSGNGDYRFIARFDVDDISEEQIELFEELARETYGTSVKTRTDSNGDDVEPENYPPIEYGEDAKSKRGGWYMGPFPSPTTNLHTGLLLFKDFGRVTKNNFLNKKESPSTYFVEIREAFMPQTDLVTFITQASVILGKGELPKKGDLLYETYYDLLRLGLKKVGDQSIYGMEKSVDMIQRELLTPLASPGISKGVKEEPQSVMMVGVPGTGKTLIVEKLLQEETGVFILPIDPYELQRELRLPKEKQTLMPRIAEVSKLTGKRVVLHIDDIENMVEGDSETHSTMLNLMAGVKESGFHIIASTNKPENIDPALLQPQRFGVLIHCGLQEADARYEILKIHADRQSVTLQHPLFESDAEREAILKNIAENTVYFTPRYLADIATIAKSFLIDRVARDKNKRIGLTEDDLQGFNMTADDWERALEEVRAKYDSMSVKNRDDFLKKFVKKNMQSTVGFSTSKSEETFMSVETRFVAEGELPFHPPQN